MIVRKFGPSHQTLPTRFFGLSVPSKPVECRLLLCEVWGFWGFGGLGVSG